MRCVLRFSVARFSKTRIFVRVRFKTALTVSFPLRASVFCIFFLFLIIFTLAVNINTTFAATIFTIFTKATYAP